MLSQLWIGFSGVRNLYLDTKNTFLRYLEAKLWHITLQWRPLFCFRHRKDVFVFTVSQAVMHSCDIFTNFGGHFVFEFYVEKGQNRAWHGADLESAQCELCKNNCMTNSTGMIDGAKTGGTFSLAFTHSTPEFALAWFARSCARYYGVANKQETFTQCLPNAGPASTTLAQN